MRSITIALVAGAALALAGCYETSTPRQYEPGVYKGKKDPLLNKLEQGDLHDQLEERFMTAARDR